MLNVEVAQPGLFDESSRYGRFLEYKFRSGISAVSLKCALKKIHTIVAAVDGLYLNLAFGASAWDLLNPSWRPQELIPFTALQADDLSMPETQADVFIWLHSAEAELIPLTLISIYQILESVAELQLDLEGLKNTQSRDLIGFVDGTANAKDDQRLPISLIPEGRVGGGGSYVISQRWQHDLAKFNHLTIHEQERVVGRTKEDDIELEGDAMPEDSHVSRTDAKVDGVGMKIYRRSSPYMASQLSATSHGRSKKSDNGLYFLAFACEMQRFTVQLDRMMGLTQDAISDKLMQFSQVKNSSYWFMPSRKDLTNLLV